MAKIIRFRSLESSGPIIANNGTITTSTPVLDLSQTWNNAAVVFTGYKLNIIDTASSASSLLMDLQVGGTSIVNITKGGFVSTGPLSNSIGLRLGTSTSDAGLGSGSGGGNNRDLRTFHGGVHGLRIGANLLILRSDAYLGWSSSTGYGTSADVILTRDAANTLALPAFRIYRTYTDASNYERGFLRWNTTTNILELGVEAAGTGSVRNVRIFTTASNNHIALGTSSSGFGVNGDGSPAMVVNSTERLSVSASLLTLQNDANFGISFSSGAGYLADTFIRRDGTGNTLAMRNSGNGQTFRLYRTFTDSSNYERLAITSTGTTRFGILAQNAGTGSARQIEISYYTSSSDPTSTDITSGTFGVWKNSDTGTIKLWANDGGTMKSVALA